MTAVRADPAGWPNYTNVVYANGVLLVPVYPGKDEDFRSRALATYARLLPDWRIVEFNATAMLIDAGGPHCAVMNLGPLQPNARAPSRSPLPPESQRPGHVGG